MISKEKVGFIFMEDIAVEYAYLNRLERKLDDKQMAACCRTENTIVAAGAGSGKTQVLATRFAWLVMSQRVPVSKILTLTFTRKAAAEMYERIYQTLSFFSSREDIPHEERELARKAIADFSESHIQTLDSYRSSIVSQAANRYGIRPDFGSGDSTLDIQLLALQFVLCKLAGEDGEELRAIRHFAGTNSMQDFARDYIAAITDSYTSLATGPEFFPAMLAKQRGFISEQWAALTYRIPDALNMLFEIPKLAKEDAAAVVGDLEAFFHQGREAFSAALFALEEGWGEGADAAVPSLVPQLFSCCARLLPLLETGEGKARVNCEECDSVLKELHWLASYVIEFPFLRGLYRLLDEFCGELNRKKRQSGILSFKDIADMAMKILVEQEDIRAQEKDAYSKIMIDEFQDNNGRDRDLLFLLSERGDSCIKPAFGDADMLHQALRGRLVADKLFFVGDEKQSIYKFRGADVAVFNELKDDLGTQMLQMTNNYRSSPELLSAFNQLFGGYRPSEGEEEEAPVLPSVFRRKSDFSYEASFPPSARASKPGFAILPELTEETARIHVCMFNEAFTAEDKKAEGLLLSAQDQTGYFIARTIAEIRAQKGGGCRYSDFAILDRSRANRPYLVRWLNAFGIPYSLDQQSSLFQEAPVNDMYSLLRLCVYPSDKMAFAAVLASPFVNLSDEGCQLVLADYAEQYPGQEAWQTFSKDLEERLAADLEVAEYGRYKAAAAWFLPFREAALQDKLSRTVDRLWNGSGYRYELLMGQSESLLSEHFDLLFEMARQGDEAGQSLAWFVDQLAAIKDKRPGFFKVDLDADISNIEYPIEREDAVSVMTIHKSKGLQFPHVFVLGCCGSAVAERAGNFFYDSEFGLSLRMQMSGVNLFFERRRQDLNQMAAEEFKRIFYVAVTRAEEDVYIVGNWKETKTKKTCDELPMLQRIICSYYEEAQSASFQTDRELFAGGAPFFFRSIAPVTKKDAFQLGRGGVGSAELVRKAEALFAGQVDVAFEHPVSNRKTPHSLETAGRTEAAQGDDLYPALGSLLSRYGGESGEDEEDSLDQEDGFIASGSFDSAAFGTLVHGYLEAQANGLPLRILKPGYLGARGLEAGDEQAVHEICASMASRFAASALGKAFAAAKEAGRFAKAEYAFRMHKDGIFYTGCIDLLFQEADSQHYTIVDYKSDARINRERYRKQLECYREAAARMLGVDERQIRLYLYFLRFDEAVEL